MTATQFVPDTILHDFIRQRRHVDVLEDDLKAEKKKLADLNKMACEYLATSGITSINIVIDGRKCNVHKRREFMCNVLAEHRPALVEACRALGLDDMIVTDVPTAKLKPYLKELVSIDRTDDGDLFDLDAIPDEIRPLVRIHEDVIAVVKAG